MLSLSAHRNRQSGTGSTTPRTSEHHARDSAKLREPPKSHEYQHAGETLRGLREALRHGKNLVDDATQGRNGRSATKPLSPTRQGYGEGSTTKWPWVREGSATLYDGLRYSLVPGPNQEIDTQTHTNTHIENHDPAQSIDTMGKTCTRCAVDKPLDDFPLKNSKAPNGPRIAMCKPCRNAYSLEKKKAKNPDMKTRNLRTNLVTEETQKCDACELVKNVTLFPEQTCKNGLPQKTCQDCQNATKAKRRDAISEGKREVGQGMAYHHPIVDGKKQCRDCEEWKVLETEFPTRKDSIDGYFHECKDCRRDNARDYGHVKWNAILSDRRENDEQYRRRVKHREGLRDTAIYKQSLDRYITETACTGHEIREWFEHRFEGDITWGTYGKGKVWTIDHVIPLVWFDLTKADERALAFNWINIQPHRENFRKHVEIRVDEIQAAFVAAHAFLQRTGEMELFSIVPKMLAWLQDKADVTEVVRTVEGLMV